MPREARTVRAMHELAEALPEARAMMRQEDGGALSAFGFTEEQVQLLDRIANGEPVRGAAQIIAAAKVRIDILKAAGPAAREAQTLVIVSPYKDTCPRCGCDLRDDAPSSGAPLGAPRG